MISYVFDMGNFFVYTILVVAGLLLLGAAVLSIATFIVSKRQEKFEQEQEKELENKKDE